MTVSRYECYLAFVECLEIIDAIRAEHPEVAEMLNLDRLAALLKKAGKAFRLEEITDFDE